MQSYDDALRGKDRLARIVEHWKELALMPPIS